MSKMENEKDAESYDIQSKISEQSSRGRADFGLLGQADTEGESQLSKKRLSGYQTNRTSK